MKFTTFRIQNFQSHADTTIDFVSGLNILVGSTNTGKSATLRALRKLIRDEPGGKAFISKWTTDMELALSFDHLGQQYTVVRKLTPSKNLYYLDAAEYGGFGKTIPQEIQDALDMKLVELETGETVDLHFSDQHDVPFLMPKGSAGIRSKLLGRIAGLHVLDLGIANINSDIRAANTEYNRSIVAQETLQAKLDDFPDLWHEHSLTEQLGTRLSDVKAQERAHAVLTAIYSQYVQLTAEIDMTFTTLQRLPDIKADFNKLRTDLTNLTRLATTLHNLQHCLDEIDAVIVLPEIVADFKGIERGIENLQKLRATYTDLTEVAKKAAQLKKEDVEGQLTKCMEEHAAMLKDFKVCPTCKSPLQ